MEDGRWKTVDGATVHHGGPLPLRAPELPSAAGLRSRCLGRRGWTGDRRRTAWPFPRSPPPDLLPLSRPEQPAPGTPSGRRPPGEASLCSSRTCRRNRPPSGPRHRSSPERATVSATEIKRVFEFKGLLGISGFLRPSYTEMSRSIMHAKRPNKQREEKHILKFHDAAVFKKCETCSGLPGPRHMINVNTRDTTPQTGDH